MRLAISLAVMGTALLAPIPSASAQTRAAVPVPAGLSATDWSSIRAVYEANRYAAFADQQAYLKASNTETFDQFGTFVAISGDTVVVGANCEDSSATGVDGNQTNNSATDSGAAYVFVRSSGVWSQQAFLKASNTGTGDNFGASVAICGDTLVVGASQEDSSATGVNGNHGDNSAINSGAAYVFVRTGGIWTQQAYLKASNTGADDLFGASISVSGDTLVVGAILEDSNATGVNGNQADNSTINSGAAYVFVRSGGLWTQQAYLKASNTGADDFFGTSLAVSDDTIVVGAWQENSSATGLNGNQADNSAPDSGAAYVFLRSGGFWSQQAYLKASNSGMNDRFGIVAISGDTAVVGAWQEDSSATGVDGNQSDNSAADSGAAYIFVRSGGVWNQQAYLKASNSETDDNFGAPVTVSGDTVVVGAWQEDSSATGLTGKQADNSAGGSGAAYVFFRSGGVWSQQAYLKASNTGENDIFGITLAMTDNTLVVGAPWESSSATGVNGNQADNSASNAGAAYVFTGVLDVDDDGILNSEDACPFNAPCLPVDAAGRPRSDLNLDCKVDGVDITPLVTCILNGGGACAGIDPDGDGQTADVDAADDIAAYSTDAVAPATVPCS